MPVIVGYCHTVLPHFVNSEIFAFYIKFGWHPHWDIVLGLFSLALSTWIVPSLNMTECNFVGTLKVPQRNCIFSPSKYVCNLFVTPANGLLYKILYNSNFATTLVTTIRPKVLRTLTLVVQKEVA